MCRNKNISLAVNYREIGIRRVNILIEEIEQTWCLPQHFDADIQEMQTDAKHKS